MLRIQLFTINCRSRHNLNRIFAGLDAKNSMLRSIIDGVELLMFTSKHLNRDSLGMLVIMHYCYYFFNKARFLHVCVVEVNLVNCVFDFLDAKI